MESVNSVKVENLKVEKGVSTWHSNVLKSIDKLEDQINYALENPDDFTSRDMDKLLSTIKADMTSISKKHKEIHNPLLKMGKIIDKNFESGDFNPVGVTNVFDTSNKDDLLKGKFNLPWNAFTKTFVLYRIRFFPTLISKIKWLGSGLPLNEIEITRYSLKIKIFTSPGILNLESYN